jgi:filamentous hemagglutinin family protein
MRLIPHCRSRVVGIGVIVSGLLVLGGAAYASGGSPFVGPHGNINSCLPPNGGVPHVWKPGHGCSGGYVGLAFPTTSATAGPTGATGMTGATGATNPSASTVNGQSVTKISGRLATPGSSTAALVLYDNDGLTITANCATNGSASLVATGPSSADSELTVSGFEGAASFGSQTNALGASSNAALGPAGSGESTFSYETSAGQVVSGQIGYQAASSFATYAGCAFFGDVTSG